MRFNLAALALVSASTAVFAGLSSAATPFEQLAAPQYQSSHVFDYNTGNLISNSLPSQENAVIVYNNIESDPNAGIAFTSASTNRAYGDDLVLTQGGELSEFYFTIFNAATAGNIATGTLEIDMYDTSTFAGVGASTPIGSFDLNIDYSADPLLPGFFSTDGVVGLQSLDIMLPTSVTVVQKLTGITGGSNRDGVASLSPVLVGSSPDDFYGAFDPYTTNEGYYNLNSGAPAQVGYAIVVPEPTTLAVLASAGLIALRRRRA